jgi:hypothetical protein
MHLTCTAPWSVVRLFVVDVPILVAVANKLPDPDSRQFRRGEDQSHKGQPQTRGGSESI